jgi:hypothetical protein
MADLSNLQSLVKALEAGGYNAAPSSLVQGSALQVEDLSPVMELITFENEHLKLQKLLGDSESCKSTLAQFDRQLSYGVFGGSAQIEGAIGQEETSDFVRIVVPMAYYSHVRRVTLVANLVATVDGKKAEERAASDAAKKLAGDIEFDLIRGKADFTNSGVFDGNPFLIPGLPNMLGLDAQVRQSDAQRNAQDLMFGEFGSDDTVVIPGGGTLTQEMIEDAHVRSEMNLGAADMLLVDPKVLSAYNKITLAKERVILAGNPQDATGADLRRQWVSGGTVKIESSRFLSGKTRPAAARMTVGAPVVSAGAVGTAAGGSTGLAAGRYVYYVTTVNEVGESPALIVVDGGANAYVDVTANQQVSIAIQPPGSATYKAFNVYRSAAGGSAATARFIGRVTAAASGNTTFLDLGNKRPGFVTGMMIQGDTMKMKELAPYSRVKLAQTDLSTPEAHFRFLTLAVTQPRKNAIIDNLVGSF